MSTQRRDPSRPAGKLRIVAGNLRGSKLAVPDVPGLRPTPDRVRETLFNWLAPVIDGARCLDLYAGTGALGIEALSRGAGECTFVERDRSLSRALRENLLRLKCERANVVEGDALSALDDIVQPFDIVFVDPPFDANLWSETARRLQDSRALRDGSWIYVESSVDTAFESPPGWTVHRQGRAGAVRFALYRRAALDPLS